nr:hypothetical protein [Tanacetum cinerariifolium]
ASICGGYAVAPQQPSMCLMRWKRHDTTQETPGVLENLRQADLDRTPDRRWPVRCAAGRRRVGRSRLGRHGHSRLAKHQGLDGAPQGLNGRRGLSAGTLLIRLSQKLSHHAARSSGQSIVSHNGIHTIGPEIHR